MAVAAATFSFLFVLDMGTSAGVLSSHTSRSVAYQPLSAGIMGWQRGVAGPAGAVASPPGLDAQMLAQEPHLVLVQVLEDGLVANAMGVAGQQQHLMRPASGQQRSGQAKRVRREDVVVGEAVNQQQRAGELRRLQQQRARVVPVRVLVRHA